MTNSNDSTTQGGLRRRDALASAGALGLGLFWTNGRGWVDAAGAAVAEDASCNLLEGADVEIWHADAAGNYSGVGSAGSSSRFLRGHQKTGAKGVARFETIYPGWYRGRTPHIHLKVHVSGNEVFTGQLFFKGSVTRAVYRTRYYKSRGQADTTNASDNIYERGSLLQLTKRRGEHSYVGRTTLVVDTA
jgi:protocatechuate 3,4-dioxygenase beta subunit